MLEAAHESQLPSRLVITPLQGVITLARVAEQSSGAKKKSPNYEARRFSQTIRNCAICLGPRLPLRRRSPGPLHLFDPAPPPLDRSSLDAILPLALGAVERPV